MTTTIEPDGSYIIYNRLPYTDYDIKIYDKRTKIVHTEKTLSAKLLPGPVDFKFTCEKSLINLPKKKSQKKPKKAKE